jgi:Subtilase family/Dockerin type I domain
MKHSTYNLKFLLTLVMGLTFATVSLVFSKAEKLPTVRNSQVKRQLATRVLPVKPSRARVGATANIAYVVVKFAEGVPVRLRSDGILRSLTEPLDAPLSEALRNYGAAAKLERLFTSAPINSLSRTQETLEAVGQIQLADLNNYYRLAVGSTQEAEQIVNELNRYSQVEIAYAMPTVEVAVDIAPPTPDYIPTQEYLDPAPAGIDAHFAHTVAGGDASGVKIIDVEVAWKTTHEDLDSAANPIIEFGNIGSDRDHGTAVLGELIGGDNGYGVTGIAPGASIGMISVSQISPADAFLMAGDNLDPGDIMLIELHAPGPRFDFTAPNGQQGFVCMEYFQAEFDAIQYLWAKGVIVVEAAGNGSEDLDDPIYENRFDTTVRNSHAIIVGAGAPPNGAWGADRSRLGFSNYGERVNLQGYGRDVVTTGYGDLFEPNADENQRYTATFGGTSSASPIVTGAVASLQGIYRAANGVSLTADIVRDILVASGSAQTGANEHIGPRPNLAAAIPALSAPPSLYTNPLFLDTTLQQGAVAVESVWLLNRSTTQAIDFSVSGNDSLARVLTPDWLQALPLTGTVPAADSIQLTVTIDASVLVDRVATYKGALDVNWGVSGGALDSFLQIPTFLQVPCEDTSYVATPSDSVGGPTFGWEEITLTGQKIPHSLFGNSSSAPLDDGTAGALTIPFDFPFFDTSYNKVWVSVNGGISFTDSSVSSNGFFGAFSIPGAPLSSFAPVFWNDLTMDSAAGGHGDVYFSQLPDSRYAITWFQMGNFNSATDTLVTFQVILAKNGDITMQYLDVGTTNLATSALVGLQDYDCSFEAFYDVTVPASLEVANGSAVRFEYTGIVLEQAGDVDGSGSVNIADVTYMIATIFSGGPFPDPPESGDVNCSGGFNIADVTFLIARIFSGGPAPCFYQL